MYENDLYSDGESLRPASTENRPAEQAAQHQEQTQNQYFDRVEENVGNDRTGSRNPDPQPPVQKPKKEKRKGTGFFRKAVCALLLAVIFGSAAGGTFYGICKYTGVLDRQEEKTVYYPKNWNEPLPADNEEKNSDIRDVSVVMANDYSQVVEEVIPAMVTILNTYTEKVPSFWGQYYTQEVQGGGTGIIIGENETELLVATNYHVVADTVKLEITFIDGTTAEGKIKGQDSEMDLAVVAIPLKSLKQETRDAIAIAKLGESQKLKLGQPAIVIGNALGIGISVTDGIISGLDRELTDDNGKKGTFIQTNAAVNSGNSGGALMNAKGEVVGIVSNKIAGISVEGMGYAIPIDSANSIISELMEHKTRDEKVDEKERGYMGVTLQTVTSDAITYYGIPGGAFVYEVSDDSPAMKAGIVRGDVITRVDGERVSSKEEVINIISYYKAGETVKITISRQEDGEYVSHDLTVTLTKRPK